MSPKNLVLRLPPSVYHTVRRHAFERNVSINQLITDVLSLWCIAATDPTDPFFTPKAMGYPLPDHPVEQYKGYLDSLVFKIDE